MHGFYLAIGKQGSGKTLFITKLMYDSLNNRTVYSNYTLFGVPFQKITLGSEIEKERGSIDILEALTENPNYFDNSIMLLDEIHIYLDSLDFMRKNNRKLQVFFSQLRKRNILLLATTQYIMNVDIRIRRQCMNVFEMSHLKDNIFKVITHEIDGYYTEEISDKLVNLAEYFNLYDTNEIIL
jgi:archaellum biogenesis ATPase FlaH